MQANKEITTLSGYAKEIFQVLKCNEQTAEKVFSKMCEYDFDFSRSSQRSFVKTAKLALIEVNNS